MKTLTIFGTRPEAIKMAPLVLALEESDHIDNKVCITAQHREMLDQVLSIFDIEADYDLDVMQPNQSLSTITSKILCQLEDVLKAEEPDLVFVHGDTSTTFTATLAAYYQQIPVAHVEAGLRTQNIYSPWPEEGNRKLTAALAEYHFAPTPQAAENLKAENIVENVVVTGNTVIDTLMLISKTIDSDSSLNRSLNDQFSFLDDSKKVILVTGHRRESFGQGFEQLCMALKKIASSYSDVELIYPVHLNPNVQEPVKKLLSEVTNIHLIEPLDYLPFVYLMKRSHFIITDSGGIQEEAPSLGKPVLVTRDTTERPEAVDAGTVILVGTDSDKIFNEAARLLDDINHYETMATAHNPYGDGKASQRIVDFIENTI